MNKQVLILTVGYPGSGKSTLVGLIRKEFPKLNVVNGDPFRELLRKEINYFSTLEFSEMTPEVERANAIAKEYKRLVFEELAGNGQSVLIEGNHLEKNRRDKWFSKAKELNPNIVTVLLYFDINDNDLLERYKTRDTNSGSFGVQEFHKWRKDQMEQPSANEADKLIVFNQSNQKQVIDELKSLLE